MINLNAYDVLEPNIKYWISVSRKTMYLKGLQSRKYYSFLYKFDSNYNDYDYYILFTDNETNIKDIKLHKLNKTLKGVFKLYLLSIWEKLQINCKKEYIEINLILEEQSNNEELYRIDFSL